ncbi:hypothetical protein [Flavobacterium suzhouense]|uniref:Uncharacterized protein n=1 Tax=Flavobacterium suzhouense TaxID=1529638 RepID=A0ABW5NWE6_9FLAO
MKQSTKILCIVIICIVLLIIFYPTEKKLNIRGNWSIDKLVVNGEEKLFGSVEIEENKIYINRYNPLKNCSYKFKIHSNDSIKICCKEEKVISRDSFERLSAEDINLEGNYKIKKSSKIIGSGTNAYYDLKLEFISKNKSIFMYNTEPVRWNKGLPARGTP